LNKSSLNHYKNIVRDGYSVIRNVISEKECNKLKKRGQFFFSKYSKFYKNKNKIEQTIYNLHNKDQIFLKYIDHKTIINIVRCLLSRGSYKKKDFIILRQSALRNPIYGHKQQLHNDARVSGAKHPMVIQIIWMLDDFGIRNGATRIVPGSHLIDKFPVNKKKYKNEKLITGKKGSVLILDASVWHGSSKKISHDTRWGMIYSYSRWFLKPSFDFNFNTPEKIYKKMNNSQKELLGFRFNPPKDEFGIISSRSKKFRRPFKYKLPKK